MKRQGEAVFSANKTWDMQQDIEAQQNILLEGSTDQLNQPYEP